MRITSELASPIVEELMSMLNHNINIMDEFGVIVASSDKTRIHQIHEGARNVVRLGEAVVIHDNDSRSLAGTKPGVNLPIEFLGRVIGVVGITGSPDEVLGIAKLTKKTVEVLLSQIHVNNRMHFTKDAMRSWIIDLINPYTFDEKKLLSIAKSLAIDTEIQRAVILCKVTCDSLDKVEDYKLRSDIDQKVVSISQWLDNRTICTYLNEGYLFFAVPYRDVSYSVQKIKCEFEASKKTWSLNLSVGSYLSGVRGYYQSYYEAIQCIHLQEKFEQTEMIYLSDWGFIRLIDQVPFEVRKTFLDCHGSALASLDKDLRYTLEVFLDNDLSVKEASKSLFIHRNTLLYRLDKIFETLNLDPRKFNDAIILKLLMICGKLE